MNILSLMLEHYAKLELSPKAFLLMSLLVDTPSLLTSDDYIRQISKHFTWEVSTMHDVYLELLNKQYIKNYLLKDHSGKQHDAIDIAPFFDVLERLVMPDMKTVSSGEDHSEKVFSLVGLFEGEFGRTLTQIELMTIANWKKEDGYQDELIQLALQQAVLNQALSLKYIDRILLSWQKKNIRTVEEAKRDIASFNQAKANRQSNTLDTAQTDFSLPEYDWGEFNR